MPPQTNVNRADRTPAMTRTSSARDAPARRTASAVSKSRLSGSVVSVGVVGGLPRAQVGTTPQHLLMTLLGDYWLGRTEHLPSAALVDLLAEFEVSEPSTRAALNRLTKRGLLVSSKSGRNTYYGLSPRAVPLLRETLKRIVAFGTQQ